MRSGEVEVMVHRRILKGGLGQQPESTVQSTSHHAAPVR